MCPIRARNGVGDDHDVVGTHWGASSREVEAGRLSHRLQVNVSGSKPGFCVATISIIRSCPADPGGGTRRVTEAGRDRVGCPALRFARSEAGRAFRPSVAATAEARALVSFTRGPAYEAGAGERRAPAFKDCGFLGRNRKRRSSPRAKPPRRRARPFSEGVGPRFCSVAKAEHAQPDGLVRGTSHTSSPTPFDESAQVSSKPGALHRGLGHELSLVVQGESVSDSGPERAGVSREASRIIPDYCVACAAIVMRAAGHCDAARRPTLTRPASVAVQARPAFRSVL